MLRSSWLTYGVILKNPFSFVVVLPFIFTSIRLKFYHIEEYKAEDSGPVLFKNQEFAIVIVLPYILSSSVSLMRATAPFSHESEHTLPDTVSWSNVTSSYSMPYTYKALDFHTAHSLFFISILYTDSVPDIYKIVRPAQF